MSELKPSPSGNENPKPKVTLIEWRPSKSIYQWVSLGLQYVAAALRQDQFEVELFIFEGETVAQCSEKIVNCGTRILGVQLFRETEREIVAIMEAVKAARPETTVIAGGHTATLYAARLLQKYPQLDVVVCGEGERTVVDLCRRLSEGADLQGCRGIFYRENALLYKTPARELIADLDQAPFPVLDPVIQRNGAADPGVFLSIATSRGCLGNCEFCVEHRGTKGENQLQWRGRSPESILRELEVYRERFPGKRLVVKFVDGAFEDPDPQGKSRLREIVRLLKERDLPLAYSFLTRAESWGPEDAALIQDLKATGLYSVAIGLESGAASSLQAFAKRATVADNLRVCRLFADAQIGYYGFFIMFHPYVQFQDLHENAEFLLETELAYRPDVWFHDVYVYPDTRFFQRVARDALLLGAEESGFHYRYAFEDGRVAQLYHVTEEIKQLRSFGEFVISYDRIILELSLYEVWKHRFAEFHKAEGVMAETGARIRSLLRETGQRQYELFQQLLRDAAAKALSSSGSSRIEAWDILLREQLGQLEQQRMIYRMHLARNQLQIL